MLRAVAHRAKQSTPWRQLRWRLVSVTLITMAVLGIVALTVVLIWDVAAGRDIAAGALIVVVPQLWFHVRGTGREQSAQAAGLALGKFALCAAGFGLWFASVKTAGLITTLAGTMGAIGVTSALIARSNQKVNR